MKFISLLIIVFLTSCNSDIQTVSNCYYTKSQKKVILKKRTIKIPIDSNVNYKSLLTFVDKNILYRINNAKNSIDIIDLDKNNELKAIKYKRNGPNKINRFGGSAIVKLDKNSFLIGNLLGEIYLTKRDSVVKKVNLDDLDIFSSQEYRLYGINDVKPIKIENKIFFYRVSQYLQTDKQFYKEKLLVCYDISTDSITEMNVLYPKRYHNKLWSFAHIHPSMTLNNNNEIIFSFPISSDLYIYNIEKNIMTKIDKCFRSKFDKLEVKSMKSNLMNFQEKNIFIKTQLRYRSIIYDKYKNIYYRIIALPIEKTINPNKREKFWDISPLVLMVLDADFNVVSEIKLPPMQYNYKEYFVNKEGLWISNNNPNNKKFNENELSYSLFQIQ